MKSLNREELMQHLSHLPHRCGVYLFKDEKGAVIYVGKAKDLRKRASSYFRSGSDGRHHIQFMLPKIREIDFNVTDTEQEALILENNLIKKHRPRYNIFLRDDKTYVNLRLSVSHPFPRLTVVRNPRKDKARYFGPFASAGAVRRTLRSISRIFPLRLCSDSELTNRTRPCLYYDINMCPAPCVDLIDPQAYRETVNRVIMFLKGKGKELIKSLKKQMDLASAERRYEEAARIRDQIWAIKRTLEKQRITSPQQAERDVFAVYRKDERMVVHSMYVRDGKVSGGDSFNFSNTRLPTQEHLSSFLNQYYRRGAIVPEEVVLPENLEERGALEEFLSDMRGMRVRIINPKKGERKKLLDLATENARAAFEGKGLGEKNRDLLEDLRMLLELKNYPRRMECFDISNIGGREAVGSGVTFVDGEPAKDLYRRYRIRMVEGVDDFRMMGEVLRRRISRGLKEGNLPDMLVVDGGRGHLNLARKVLEALGTYDIDVAAIAKVRSAETGRKIKGRERIYAWGLSAPIMLEGNSRALMLLERIRDEAHRFAISYHKTIRRRRLTASILDGIPGVGPKIRSRLLKHFGSLEGISMASEKEIAGVPGVSEKLARRLKEGLAEPSTD